MGDRKVTGSFEAYPVDWVDSGCARLAPEELIGYPAEEATIPEPHEVSPDEPTVL
jgi:hypothetical protein